MMYRNTAIRAGAAVLLAVCWHAAYAVQDCEFNGQHINTNNGAETAGKTGMVRCKDRDTGRAEREYELRNGQSIGLSRYYRDGKLAKEFTITANGPHEGLEREWAPNGQLVLEFTNVGGNSRGLRSGLKMASRARWSGWPRTNVKAPLWNTTPAANSPACAAAPSRCWHPMRTTPGCAALARLLPSTPIPARAICVAPRCW